MREVELFEQTGRVRGQAIEILERTFGLREPHQFDFLELVLADQAPRILAGGARFFAKARRVRGILQR